MEYSGGGVGNVEVWGVGVWNVETCEMRKWRCLKYGGGGL